MQPRTKPLPGEEGGEEDAEEGAEDAEDAEDEAATPGDEQNEPTSSVMSIDKVKTKIDADMKELWGEKDLGGSRNPDDIVEYLRALPEGHRHFLTERLAEDVFRISKYKDAEVVARGWTQALADGVVSKEVLVQGWVALLTERIQADKQARSANAISR